MVRVFGSMYWVAGLPTLYRRALMRPLSYLYALSMLRETRFTGLWESSDGAGSLVCRLNPTRGRGHLCAARRGCLKQLQRPYFKPVHAQQVGIGGVSEGLRQGLGDMGPGP